MEFLRYIGESIATNLLAADHWWLALGVVAIIVVISIK